MPVFQHLHGLCSPDMVSTPSEQQKIKSLLYIICCKKLHPAIPETNEKLILSPFSTWRMPTVPRTTLQRPTQNSRRCQRRYNPSCRSPVAVARHLSQHTFSVSTMRTTCKSRTSAQNLHHRPAKPLSFFAAPLHVTQLSPINPIIVISDILTVSVGLLVVGCGGNSYLNATTMLIRVSRILSPDIIFRFTISSLCASFRMSLIFASVSSNWTSTGCSVFPCEDPFCSDCSLRAALRGQGSVSFSWLPSKRGS
jgi:hypothetical protein